MNDSLAAQATVDGDQNVLEAGAQTPPDLLVDSDLLVEDVSIDGMCGVY